MGMKRNTLNFFLGTIMSNMVLKSGLYGCVLGPNLIRAAAGCYSRHVLRHRMAFKLSKHGS